MFFNFFKFNKNNRGFIPLETEGRCEPSRFLTGFTALELLVVISIFTIMTGVVLANLPKFRDQTSVGLVAQQIALVARQAQVYGNSWRQLPDGNQVRAYGLYFSITLLGLPAGIDKKSFIVFGDKSGNYQNYYDYVDHCGGTTTECMEKFTLPGGIIISGISYCTSSNSCGSVATTPNSINIMFRRVYPDAQFYNGSGGGLSPGSCAIIRISSTRDPNLKKDVIIWSTGHIYTKDVPLSGNYSC